MDEKRADATNDVDATGEREEESVDGNDEKRERASS